MAIGWSSKRVFKLMCGELAAMSGRTFERGILPYLRIVHPELVNPPELEDFDVKGADHVVWAEAESLPLVVQCKGFKPHVRGLGRSHIRQCLSSIRAFRRSGLKARTYLLVHNRTSKDPKFRNELRAELDSLVSSGIAGRAELWDLERSVRRAHDAMYERLRKMAREHNLSVVKEYVAAEPELCEPLQQVPLRTSVLTADQYRLSRTSENREEVAD